MNSMQAHHVCEAHTKFEAGVRILMERSFHPVLQTCTVHLRDICNKQWVNCWICKSHENDQNTRSFKISLLQTVVVISSSSYTRHRQLIGLCKGARAYAEHTRYQLLQPDLDSAVCSQLAILLGLHVSHPHLWCTCVHSQCFEHI